MSRSNLFSKGLAEVHLYGAFTLASALKSDLLTAYCSIPVLPLREFMNDLARHAYPHMTPAEVDLRYDPTFLAAQAVCKCHAISAPLKNVADNPDRILELTFGDNVRTPSDVTWGGFRFVNLPSMVPYLHNGPFELTYKDLSEPVALFMEELSGRWEASCEVVREATKVAKALNIQLVKRRKRDEEPLHIVLSALSAAWEQHSFNHVNPKGKTRLYQRIYANTPKRVVEQVREIVADVIAKRGRDNILDAPTNAETHSIAVIRTVPGEV